MPTWRVITSSLRSIPLPEDYGDELFQDQVSALARRDQRKNTNTRVSIHLCPHAAGESASDWYNCKDDPRAVFEEL